MTFDQILSDLKKGDFKPVYLLQGEEAYFIDIISDYIEAHALDEAGKAFNQMVLYGKDIDVKDILDEVRQYPMMAERRVVIVKEAQDLKKINDLEAYANQPSPTSVLVLAHKYKKIRKNTKLAKAVVKSGVFFSSDKIPEYKMGAWIQNFIRDKGYSLDTNTADLIAEYLGNDLSKVSNEVGKLLLNLGDEKKISADHVQEHIGISKEYNIFEFQKALSQKDMLKIHRIINFFAGDQKNNHISMILGSLYNYFTKVYTAGKYATSPDGVLMKHLGVGSPYFVKEYKMAARQFPPQKMPLIFEALKTADKHSKGVESRSADAQKILQELVFKIY